MRTCKYCGKSIGNDRASQARYCSDACKRAYDNEASKARSKRRIRERLGVTTCRSPYCVNEFVPLKGKQYCSKDCLYLGSQARFGKGAEQSAAIFLGQLQASRIWFFTCTDCGNVFAHHRKTYGRKPLCGSCSDEHARKTNARKNHSRRAAGKLTLGVHDIARRDGARCNICSRRVDMSLSGAAKWGPTIDHLIPVSAGGTNHPSNLALAHRFCNTTRSNSGAAQMLLTT